MEDLVKRFLAQADGGVCIVMLTKLAVVMRENIDAHVEGTTGTHREIQR